MATIKWKDSIENYSFDGAAQLATYQSTKAVFSFDASLGRIVMYGEKLREQNDVLVSGSIDKIVFEGYSGEELLVATGGNYKASKLGTAAINDGAFGIFEALFRGDDKITGTEGGETLEGFRGDDKILGHNGADIIFGGRGDDILTGGRGADGFYFENDVIQHDIIKDLEVFGHRIDQIEIVGEIVNVRKIHSGDDTLLTIDNGSTILLEDVTKQEFESYWMQIS